MFQIYCYRNFFAQPCNPAVGGPAKSQLVHEVDALGGEIGKVADRYCLKMSHSYYNVVGLNVTFFLVVVIMHILEISSTIFRSFL